MRLRSRAAISALGVVVVGLIAQRADTQQTPPRPLQPLAANKYADPALCETCHAEIAANFHKTGMGRSFYRLQPANAVEDFTLGKPFYHEASNTYIAMLDRGGKYYQRRWQKGIDGGEINVDEKQVDFVMGSGNHGRTYLHLTPRGSLQQLPSAGTPREAATGPWRRASTVPIIPVPRAP